ncbi:MAG: hypothetical protein ACRDMX_14965, partial [Solirubrobacteraceae bacterium]
IDGDYVDAPTAAAGNGPGIAPAPAPAPSLSISSGPDGSVRLTPTWSYEPGIAAWQPVAGATPTALAPVAPSAPVGSPMPIVANDELAYWAIEALGSAGQVLGTSAPVANPSALAIFGASTFMPVGGLGGVPVGCFSISPCWVTAKVFAGRTRLARTRPEHLRSGSGLVFFKLSRHGRALLSANRNRQIPVTVAVRDSTGHSASRRLTLASFSTADPTPGRKAGRASGLAFVGLTEFVSHGWVGGVLARCSSPTPCATTTTLVAGHSVIAKTAPETLGAGELGYLLFKLTPAGHRLLMHARGNQLGTYATIVAGAAFARAHVVLVAFR